MSVLGYLLNKLTQKLTGVARTHTYRLGFTCVFTLIFMGTWTVVQQKPQQAWAQSPQVGTHLGHFDLGAQIGVLGHIRGTAGAGAGYPVVINLDIGWSQADMQALADAVGDFRVAVRLIGITSQTSGASLESAASTLNAVTWQSTGKPILVVGNEVNNQEVEWKNRMQTPAQAGQQYGSFFEQFRTGVDATIYEIAPAALDMYNTAYPWEAFVGLPGTITREVMRAVFLSGSYFAINVYGGGKPWDEIPTTVGFSKRSIITEWGPMPPDSNLRQYADWYATQPIPAGVEFAIALVKNTCKPALPTFGTFYWVNGKMWMLVGETFSEADVDNCSGALESPISTLSRTINDEIPNEIFVYRDIFMDILGKGSQDFDRALTAGLSRAQRYVMSCAPQFWIGAQVDPQDRQFYYAQMQEQIYTLRSFCLENAEPGNAPFGTNHPNCMFNPITANFVVLNNSLATPLYRNVKTGSGPTLSLDENNFATMSSETREGFYNSLRTDSIESYFGTNTRLGREQALHGLSNPAAFSPNSKLLQLDQQCAQNIRYLKAIEELCKEGEASNMDAGLLSPAQRNGNCAINHTVQTEGPAKGKTYLEILNEIKIYAAEQTGLHFPEILDGVDSVDYCRFNAPWSTLGLTAKRDQDLDAMLVQVQPIMKNAFKIGYLVYYNNGRYFFDGRWDSVFNPVNVPEPEPTESAFGNVSRYFHPVYRTFDEFFNKPTFDIIPFLVPANVFSTYQDEELLDNPMDPSQDYETHAEASYDAPYTTVLRALLPQDSFDALLDKKNNRKSAIGSAIDYGMNADSGNFGRSWNGLNDSGNERPYIHCPYCDPQYTNYPPAVTPKKIGGADSVFEYDMLSAVLWHRINGGIYAKEISTYTYPADTSTDAEGNQYVASLPDQWNRCNVAPELVGGESANLLNTPGGNSFWGQVKQSVTNITALVRAPSGQREDKYNYEIRGYLLLPEEYGFLADTESQLLKLLLPQEYQEKIFIDEQKQNDIGQFIGNSSIKEGKVEGVPDYNRFLRLNGQIFSLEGRIDSIATKGEGSGYETDPDDGSGPFFSESPEEFAARVAEAQQSINTCLSEVNANPFSTPSDIQGCNQELERQRFTVTAKINSWNPGWNEGDTDLRPLLPGGLLAQGIFTLMAQVLSPADGPNYQLEYCGLEDYWAVGGCQSRLSPTRSSAFNPTSCDQIRSLQTTMLDVAGTKAIVQQVANQYRVPADLLWGTFIIEGGTARNLMYDGGGTIACAVNSIGAVGPMQHLKNVCYTGSAIEPEDDAAKGKDVCDFRTAIEVTAARYASLSRAEDFQNLDGTPNWYWIAGQYYFGSSIEQYKDITTGMCKNAPAVQGCPIQTPDYCSCAVEGFPIN